ncbi:MAG: M15 family metallopeptidase [Bacteroidota bacterium]
MKFKVISLALLPIILSAQSGLDEFVNPKDIIPDIVIDLRYSTPNHSFLNIPGEDDIPLPKFYTCNESLVLLKLANALKLAQDYLRSVTSHNGKEYPKGIGIKIWDGYRPRAIQYLLFEAYPNPVYVANPSSGSMHNRGGAIDLTLIDLATGEELEMPTEFDDFSTDASHSNTNLTQEVINNRELLRYAMHDIAELSIYSAEWWHYNLPDAGSYPLQDFQMK